MNVDELFMQRYGMTPADFSAENVTQATPTDLAMSPWKPLDFKGVATAGAAVREKFAAAKEPEDDGEPVEAAML